MVVYTDDINNKVNRICFGLSDNYPQLKKVVEAKINDIASRIP